jgi:hypothetical protein
MASFQQACTPATGSMLRASPVAVLQLLPAEPTIIGRTVLTA